MRLKNPSENCANLAIVVLCQRLRLDSTKAFYALICVITDVISSAELVLSFASFCFIYSMYIVDLL